MREALEARYNGFEEGKADVLGLYMVTALRAQGEIPEGTLDDDYVTFLASIFRSVRFGAASAHGRANVARFNFFQDLGAFTRNAESGRYRVHPERMALAVDSLSATILRIQGEGDRAGADAFMERFGRIGPELQGDLDRLAAAGIPVDVVFEQGPDVLGLDAADPAH